MLYRPYGSTGEQVSVISAGGMRFANPQDIDANAEVLLHAYRAGVNYFDTAPGYCADKSEEIVGAALRQMKKEPLGCHGWPARMGAVQQPCATHLPPDTAADSAAVAPATERLPFYVSTKSSAEDPAKLREHIERSLKRFGVERIDYFHIWCILSMEGWGKRAAALKAARKAREEGLIRHLVVSSHLPGDELGRMLEEGHFEGVTMGYSAINFPYRRAAVETARRMNLGVVAMNPLGGGLIPRNAERFAFLRSAADKTTVQASLRFVISTPGLTSALVGFTTKEHVDEAVAALDGFVPYGEEHFARLQEQILGAFDELCTGCGYCLPCPEGLAIPKLMDAYNQKLLNTGEGDHIGSRLKWHWGVPPASAGACSLCGQCEDKCTQHLPIRERMKEIAEGAKK